MFKQVIKVVAKKYLPSGKEELKELVTNPEICLGDIDTSLITDMIGDLMAAEEMTFQALRTGTLSRD